MPSRIPIIFNSYTKKRLKLISSYSIGNYGLDIGYAINPNPYLSFQELVGFDKREPLSSTQNYHKKYIGDVKYLLNIIGKREFDTIICGELIEHLEEPYEFLRDVRQLLSENGILIISTPNPLGFPVLLLEYFMSKKYFFEVGHKYYFLPRWLSHMLFETGYELKKIIPVGLWFPCFVIPVPFYMLSYQLIYLASRRN